MLSPRLQKFIYKLQKKGTNARFGYYMMSLKEYTRCFLFVPWPQQYQAPIFLFFCPQLKKMLAGFMSNCEKNDATRLGHTSCYQVLELLVSSKISTYYFLSTSLLTLLSSDFIVPRYSLHLSFEKQDNAAQFKEEQNQKY